MGLSRDDRSLVVTNQSGTVSSAHIPRQPGFVGGAQIRHGQRGFAQLTVQSCPPRLGVQVETSDGKTIPCIPFADDSIALLAREPAIRTVVLNARWAAYAEATRFGVDDPGANAFLTDNAGKAHTVEGSRRVLARSLQRTLDELHRLGKRVVVVGQVPELGINAPRCLAHSVMAFGRADQCDVLASAAATRDAFSDTLIVATARRSDVCVRLPRATMCDAVACRPLQSGAVLYRDDDHLSASGARWLIDRLQLANCFRADDAR